MHAFLSFYYIVPTLPRDHPDKFIYRNGEEKMSNI